MLDPTSLLLAGASAAHSVLSGKTNEKQVQQLAVRYWGQVLFELRLNLSGITEMAVAGRQGRYPKLRLRAWDELYGSLCKLTSMPRLISSVQELNNDIEEIGFLLRTALAAIGEDDGPMIRRRPGGHQWDDAFRQARELAAQKPEARFNEARDVIASAGRAAFGEKDWQMVESEILPDPL